MMQTLGQQQLQHLSPCWRLQTHTCSKDIVRLLQKAQQQVWNAVELAQRAQSAGMLHQRHHVAQLQTAMPARANSCKVHATGDLETEE